MTGHNVTLSRWEAIAVGDAVIGILSGLAKACGPSRTTCPDCRALIRADAPCPICAERRRGRQDERIHKTA